MNRKRSIIPLACALFAALAFAGCYQPVDYPVIVDVPPPAAVTVPLVHRYIVGTSIENRPIEYLVLGQGRDVTFILAAIHGNEPAGIPLVRRLAQYLQQYPQLLQGRKVVLLPVANPDGVAHNSRFNARGVDLNRNFSTANRINSRRFGRTALSEPEARVIEHLIRQYTPDRVVSIHQPLACIDYDGPGKALARRMSEYCNLPLIKLGPKPGSLGSYAGVTLRIPTITLELPHIADRLSSQRLWQRYGPALIAAVVYPDRVR
jgi:protein MpaA